MTDQMQTQNKPSLGVGAIISETFSIFGRNFVQILLVGTVLMVLSFLISAAFLGLGVALGVEEMDLADFSAANFALPPLINLVVYGLMTAILVQLAYDSKLGKPINLSRYISVGLSVAIPICILSMVVGIAVLIGFVFLVVPGLWIYGVFYVMPAAVTIERVGFSGLGRSANLTKEYRWPIVGLFLVMIVLSILLNLVATTIGAIVISITGTIGSLLVVSVLSAISAGLLSISVALAYARLREIKEGVTVDQIASVFE